MVLNSFGYDLQISRRISLIILQEVVVQSTINPSDSKALRSQNMLCKTTNVKKLINESSNLSTLLLAQLSKATSRITKHLSPSGQLVYCAHYCFEAYHRNALAYENFYAQGRPFVDAGPGPFLHASEGQHCLTEVEGPKSKTRKRCRGCYDMISLNEGSREATKKAKKVSTYCKHCENKPYLCLSCFENRHRSTQVAPVLANFLYRNE